MTEILQMLDGVGRWVFGLICHQDTAFLMRVEGRDVQLCPRCLGMHSSFSLAYSLSHFLLRDKTISHGAFVYVVFPALALMPAHWLCGSAGIIHSDIVGRLITGAITGAALAIMLVLYRSHYVRPQSAAAEPMRTRNVAGIIALSTIVVLLFLTSAGYLRITLSALGSVGGNLYLIVKTGILRIANLINTIKHEPISERRNCHENK